MAFSINSKVLVKRLKKRGCVSEIIKPGLYRVAVGSLSIQCKEQELEQSDAPEQAHPDDPHTKKSKLVTAGTSSKELESLDLHGLSVAQAIPLVEQHLNRAILAGIDHFQIVHGHGTGKIRQAVHQYLKGLSVVKNFKIDDFNPGSTKVFI